MTVLTFRHVTVLLHWRVSSLSSPPSQAPFVDVHVVFSMIVHLYHDDSSDIAQYWRVSCPLGLLAVF